MKTNVESRLPSGALLRVRHWGMRAGRPAEGPIVKGIMRDLQGEGENPDPMKEDTRQSQKTVADAEWDRDRDLIGAETRVQATRVTGNEQSRTNGSRGAEGPEPPLAEGAMRSAVRAAALRAEEK